LACYKLSEIFKFTSSDGSEAINPISTTKERAVDLQLKDCDKFLQIVD
jgi:hypothetical protein